MFFCLTQAAQGSRGFATVCWEHQEWNVSSWKRYPCYCVTMTLVFPLRCLFLHSSHQYTYLLFWWFCCGSVWRRGEQAGSKFGWDERMILMILMTLTTIRAPLDLGLFAFKCIHLLLLSAFCHHIFHICYIHGQLQRGCGALVCLTMEIYNHINLILLLYCVIFAILFIVTTDSYFTCRTKLYLLCERFKN